jgi:hypothetical protein
MAPPVRFLAHSHIVYFCDHGLYLIGIYFFDF